MKCIYGKKIILLIVLSITLSGCAGAPIIQDWPNVAYEKEDIIFSENNSNAKVKWVYEVDTPKIVSTEGKRYFRPGKTPSGEAYFINSSPIVTKEEIYVQKNGEVEGLNPLTGETLHRYGLKSSVKKSFILDEFRQDPEGKVFSILFDNILQKYVLVKNESEIKVQRYDRATKSIGRWMDYYKGKFIHAVLGHGSIQGTVSIQDAFTNKFIWTQPKELLNPLTPIWTKNKYYKLVSVVFDRDKEVIAVLYQAKKQKYDYLLVGYRFTDGKRLWEKSINTNFPDELAGSTIILYGSRLIFMEALVEQKEEELINPVNRIYDIVTGEEIYSFEGFVNLRFNEIEGGIYYVQADSEEERGRTFIYDYYKNQLREIELEKIDTLMGIKQLGNQLIYFTNEKNEWISYDILKNNRIRVLGYNGIRAVDINTLEMLWDVELGVQEFEPVIDEGVIYIGDPAGQGKVSEVMGGGKDGLSNEAIVIDTKTGKILWKAKISNDGRITRMAVLGNMAFIKTLNGNLFAIEWEKK